MEEKIRWIGQSTTNTNHHHFRKQLKQIWQTFSFVFFSLFFPIWFVSWIIFTQKFTFAYHTHRSSDDNRRMDDFGVCAKKRRRIFFLCLTDTPNLKSFGFLRSYCFFCLYIIYYSICSFSFFLLSFPPLFLVFFFCFSYGKRRPRSVHTLSLILFSHLHRFYDWIECFILAPKHTACPCMR